MVIGGADHDAVAVLGVIDMMRLKPKPANDRREFAGKLADAGKSASKPKVRSRDRR